MNTNNTHEKYVSLETAKLLKEAGFDWTIDCDFVYAIFNDRTEFLNDIYVINAYQSNLRPGLGPLDRDSYVCKYHAPTFSVAKRWLRQVKNLHIIINYVYTTGEFLYQGTCYLVTENDPTIEILGITCKLVKHDVLFCGETKTYTDPDDALDEILYSAALYAAKGRDEWKKWYKTK